jgi:hypothetical protein
MTPVYYHDGTKLKSPASEFRDESQADFPLSATFSDSSNSTVPACLADLTRRN